MKPRLTMIPICMMVVLYFSCSPPATDDQKFQSLANNYLERLLQLNPEWATVLGDHRFDGRLGDYSMAGVASARTLAASYLDSLSTVDLSKLNRDNAVDCRILKHSLQATIFSIDTLREYEWNPLNYNVGGAIYSLLAREFAPLETRLGNVKSRLEQIPAVLQSARANLKSPPRIHTETAMLQNPGTISMVRDQLNEFLEKAPSMKAEITDAQTKAIQALEEYGAWLKDDLLPRSTGDFRIWDEKFRRKLYYTLESNLTKEEILTRAEADLKKTQESLYETALPLFRKHVGERANKEADRELVIKQVLNKIAESHPTNETIVELAREYTDNVSEFVREKNLVTVPTEPIKIIVMPEFQRGVAVAYCDAPGALEKNGETFYAISPTPADWTKERTSSFFREYNSSMLQNLTIHEATPGHYLQLAHANKFKAPTMIRGVLGSGTFVEGWATYAEQFMVEAGFGGPEVKMQQLKMRLRLIINSIIDQKIHTAGMTEAEAKKLMMEEGFQEDGEAAGKWRRACLTSTQLSTYYVGNIELNNIRTAYEKKHGMQSELRTMHDAMLASGSPAPRYVMEMLGL